MKFFFNSFKNEQTSLIDAFKIEHPRMNDVNTSSIVLLTSVSLSIIAFIFVVILLPYWMNLMRKKGKTGIDIHKQNKPVVPEMGGFIPVTVYLLSIITLLFLYHDPEIRMKLIALTLGTLIAMAVGIYDDFKPLNAILKPTLLILASIPLILLKAYNPHPIFPFIGETRLTIVYLFLLPFVVTVPGNAMNMLDVLNGSMSGTAIIISTGVLIGGLIVFPLDTIEGQILLLTLLPFIAVMLGFYLYNKYPAKTFSGDTGSLSAGAILGMIAVLGRVELIMMFALLPHIMNSFSILGSIKGLKERRNIKTRPVRLLEDARIYANTEKEAPMTLTRILVAQKPKTEKEIVHNLFAVTLASTVLAIITAIIIKLSI